VNRFLSIFNCLGVGVLAVLCAIQWRANSRLENNVEQLDKTRIEQSAKIAEQEITLKDDAADLEDLRQRLSMSESELQKAVAEGTRLKATLSEWMAAVHQRDAALKQAGQQIQKLAGERNEAIQKFNDLADKYNALVKQMGSNSK
jgi:chromosome segregation ATPase